MGHIAGGPRSVHLDYGAFKWGGALECYDPSQSGAHTDSGLRPDRRDGAGSAARRSATRQGRLLFVYLALNRLRPTSRDELVNAWHEHRPGGPTPASARSCRSCGGSGPERLWVATPSSYASHRMRGSISRRRPRPCIGRNRLRPRGLARGMGRGTRDPAHRAARLPPGEDAPWAQERRRLRGALPTVVRGHHALEPRDWGQRARHGRAVRSLTRRACALPGERLPGS